MCTPDTQVHEWAEGAAGPHLLFSCHVANASAAVADERGLFARVSGERPSSMPATGPGGARPPLPELLRSYQLRLQRQWHDPAAMAPPPALAAGGGGGAGGAGGAASCSEERAYIVSQARGGGEVAEVAEQLSKHFGVPLVPWGAVAADVTAAVTTQHGPTAAAVAPPEDGRAFCFLPLPARTGLPVHVNGYFELSSNRRDIWCVQKLMLQCEVFCF